MRRKHTWKAVLARFACVRCGEIYQVSCPHGQRCWRCFNRHAEGEPDCAERFGKIFYAYLECRRALYDAIEESAPVTWAQSEGFRFEVEHLIRHVRKRLMQDYVKQGEPWGPGEEGLERWLLEMRRRAEDLAASHKVDYLC